MKACILLIIQFLDYQKYGSFSWMEATGHYMEGVAQFMHDNEMNVSIINPAQIKAFGNSELLRGKTDKSDSAMIARF